MLAAARAFGAPAPSATDAAQNLTPPIITSDEGTADFDGSGDFLGHARWRQGPLLLTSDQMHFDRKTNTLIARGHVTLTNKDERMLADYLEYRRNLGTFLARDVRIGRFPIYIQGETADGVIHTEATDGREEEMTIHNAIVTYTDPGAWKPSIKAKTLIYSPGHYMRSVKSMVGVEGAEVIPVGSLRENLNSALHSDLVTFEVGYRSSLGGIVTVGAHVPVGDGFRIGGDISEYTKRGFMMGPSGSYADPDGSNDWHGSFTSGYIDDHGERLTDVLGNQIPSTREFATWEHVQNIGDDWTITGEANYWSDADITRDFRPKQFLPVQTPDTYVDAIHFGDNDFAEVFARLRPNNFEDVQERLPEVSYDLAALAIGGGFYERGSASAVMLQERPPIVTPAVPAPLGPTLSDTRLDAYYSISRPINPTSWFNFTPIAGFRVTDYLDTQGAVTDGHYLRSLGEIGFDSEARASGIYDYKNLNWDIDGIRHLIVPQISYRYIPGSESGNPSIPAIDTQTFSPYLQPLELGDARAVDDLGRRNTLRLGIDNIFQTRDASYGSRDLLNLNIADDINFIRTPLEPDISDLHAELAVTPAKWIEFEAANVTNVQTFTLREIDAGVTFKDGNVWSLRLATDFYRHDDHDYSANYSLRLTETFTGIIMVQYSARQNVFDELAVGVTQNLGNVWSVQYLITDNGGPNRDGRLDVRVSLLMLKF